MGDRGSRKRKRDEPEVSVVGRVTNARCPSPNTLALAVEAILDIGHARVRAQRAARLAGIELPVPPAPPASEDDDQSSSAVATSVDGKEPTLLEAIATMWLAEVGQVSFPAPAEGATSESALVDIEKPSSPPAPAASVVIDPPSSPSPSAEEEATLEDVEKPSSPAPAVAKLVDIEQPSPPPAPAAASVVIDQSSSPSPSAEEEATLEDVEKPSSYAPAVATLEEIELPSPPPAPAAASVVIDQSSSPSPSATVEATLLDVEKPSSLAPAVATLEEIELPSSPPPAAASVVIDQPSSPPPAPAAAVDIDQSSSPPAPVVATTLVNIEQPSSSSPAPAVSVVIDQPSPHFQAVLADIDQSATTSPAAASVNMDPSSSPPPTAVAFKVLAVNKKMPTFVRELVDLPIANSEADQDQDEIVGSDYELDIIPGPNEELPRVPSPDDSPRKSAAVLDQLKQYEELCSQARQQHLLKERNEGVEKFVKPPPNPDMGEKLKCKVKQVQAQAKSAKKKQQEYDDSESPVDSDEEVLASIGPKINYHGIQNQKGLNMIGMGMGAQPFNHISFQMALQAKWRIMELKRLEQIMTNEKIPEIPAELYEHDKQFEKIYGPMDRESARYKILVEGFQQGRLEKIGKMKEFEEKAFQLIKLEKAKPGSTPNYKPTVEAFRKEYEQLEEMLKMLPESQADLNPYTSPFCQDMFVLPRKQHPLSTYEMRAKEMDGFTEVAKDEKTTFVKEGYNPAVMDVGLRHPTTKVKGDFKRMDYFNGKFGAGALGLVAAAKGLNALASKRKPAGTFDTINISKSIRVFNNWEKHLADMSKLIMEYPKGIEANVFFRRFRERAKLFSSETLFGDLTDMQGINRVSEVFMIQPLGEGKHKKLILFHRVLEDQIVTPKELLEKVWKRIQFQAEQEKRIEMQDLGAAFQRFNGCPLFPLLDWGFKDGDHFVDYCRIVIPDELKKFVKVDKEKAEALQKVQEVNAAVAAAAAGGAEGGATETEMWEKLYGPVNVAELEDFVDDGTWFEIDDPLVCDFSKNNNDDGGRSSQD